jgi:hypothetical protein
VRDALRFDFSKESGSADGFSCTLFNRNTADEY